MQVGELFLAKGSDRLKLLILYSGEDDERLRLAASGTLAVLTSLVPQICVCIPESVSLCVCVCVVRPVLRWLGTAEAQLGRLSFRRGFGHRVL